MPKWIWGPKEARDNQVQIFRLTFDAKIPTTQMTEDPSAALLWVAGDDDITVSVNGKSVGEARRTGTALILDVRSHLTAGKNVIAIKCHNVQGPAGIVAKLVVRGQYREPFYLISDEHWKCSEEAPKRWRDTNFDDSGFVSARVIGPYGMAPWGKLAVAAPAQSTTVEHLTLLPGFKAELLYSVPRDQQGSWVSMTSDPKGPARGACCGGRRFPRFVKERVGRVKATIPLAC